MIPNKLWKMVKAQLNKLVNYFRGRDPIAEMQLECDLAAEQLKEGRRGLEQYRGLVERVTRQVAGNHKQEVELEAKVRSYLNSGDRATAGTLALEFERVGAQRAENEAQLHIHEEAYQNNLLKLQHATRKISEVRQRIATYDATLRMSRAEAEIAKLAQSLDFDVTTDFGQVEQVIQEKIDQSRAEVRVAADLSNQGVEDIRREQDVEKQRAEQALGRFTAQLLGVKE
jgi:phage shock protein A